MTSIIEWFMVGDRLLCVAGPIFFAAYILFIVWSAFIRDPNKH